MGLFSNILSAIFKHAPAQPNQSSTTPPPPGKPASTPDGGTPSAPQGAIIPEAPAGVPTAATTPVAPVTVDVDAVLSGLAAKNSEHLDWKSSIVDLLKLLNLDSSLSARKELAAELHYTGNTSDSAAMNIWLHKAVLTKLSENGGKVPADLLS